MTADHVALADAITQRLLDVYPPGPLGVPHCGQPQQPYACTRARGHTGPHVAHGIQDNEIVRWTEPDDT